VLVGLAGGVLAYFFTHDVKLSVALGVVLGAISSATDPASTIQVLWEYKTRGPLTTAAIAVVALDDVLALSLYALGTSLAGVLTGHQSVGMIPALGSAVYEIVLALFVGFVGALSLYWILMRIQDSDTILTFVIGAVLLVIGLSIVLKVDIILSSMALGLTLVNCAPRRTERAFEAIKKFAPPIYVLFFVLVGARLKVAGMPNLAWWLVLAYIVGRTAGKMVGAYVGAVWSRGADTVKRYLGLCLFAQGGVAIGLSILASHRFENQISSIVILVVTATTFVVQLAGPFFVKIGANKAGEVGLNINEEDLIKQYTVKDVMDVKTPVISAGLSLSEVIRIVSNTDNFYYPVVDTNNRLIGGITLDGIRSTFATEGLNDFLVALDIVEPIVGTVTPGTPLAEALETTNRLGIEHAPVIASEEQGKFLGVLNCRAVRRSLSAEVLSRQQKADSIAAGQSA